MNIKKMIPWESKTYHVGQRFGRNVIISLHKLPNTPGTRPPFQYFARCQCDCGNQPRYVHPDSLKKGISLSCGCLQVEIATKHGLDKHPLCPRWRAMMRRCYSPQDSRYKDYGGRGITVCERWHDVRNFIADMSEGYQKGLQIDRKDNDKGYSPENCRWINSYKQAQNKRNNVSLTFQEKTLTLPEWSETTGIPYKTLWCRIKRGMSIERALTLPVMDVPTSTAHARSFQDSFAACAHARSFNSKCNLHAK
jgi:hypothetical protein